MNIFLSKKSLVFLYTLANFSILAEIIEIKQFHEILAYVIPGSLVLLDIDNTLLEPHTDNNHIGSDQWFTYLIRTQPSFEDALNLYCSTILITQMQVSEASIPQIVCSIQEHAVVLGFTMRSIILAPITVQELKQNGVILTNTLVDKGFMVNGKNPVMVYHDIIFCQGQKNGTTLFTVLDAYQIKPTTVVMVDDKRHYLESVERECEKLGIRFIGLRYGYLDEKVATYLKGSLC
jgi:FMN phosphatase YigB (HAD superfamily)